LNLWRCNEARMLEHLAKANIEHFRKLLEIETDVQKRSVLDQLLAEEESKLAALKKPSAKQRN